MPNEDKNFDSLYLLTIVSACAVCLVLITVFALKNFSPETFKEIENSYKENFLIETEIKESL